MARFSNSEAITHFNYALNHLPNSEGLTREEEIALIGLGDAYYASNKFNEAIATYVQLADRQSGSKKANTLVKAMYPAFFLADTPLLTKLVREAEAIPEITRLEIAKVLHFKGAISNLQCKFLQARKYHEEALEIFEEEYALHNAAWLMFILADGTSNLGGKEKAVALALKSNAIFDDLSDLNGQMEAISEVGATFHNVGLLDQAIIWYQKAIDFDRKNRMNNYFMLGKTTLFLAHAIETTDIQNALLKNHEALELCNKSDANMFIARIYANLTRLYSKIGDITKADEYYTKLMALPPPLIESMYSRLILDISLAVYFAAKDQQELSKQHLDRHLNFINKSCLDSKLLLQAKPNEAWILTKQAKTEQAAELLKEIHTGIEDIRLQFEKTNLQSSLMTRRVVRVGEEFEIRLDIINVGYRDGQLLKVEELIPTNFTLSKIQQPLQTVSNSIEFINEKVAAFGDKVIKISGYVKDPGVITLKPRIYYTDSNGTAQISLPKTIQVTAQPTTNRFDNQDKPEGLTAPVAFDFNSVAASQSFECLVRAFNNDYMRKKIAFEKSGWRSLTQISKETNLPLSSFYSKRGRFGLAIAELERRGLVEVRVFPGERGRGGKILRTRIDVEKTFMKEFVKNKIAKEGGK